MQVGIFDEMTFFSRLHPLVAAGYFVELFTLLLIFNHLLLTLVLFASLCGLCGWYFNRQKVWGTLKGVGSLMALIWAFNVVLNQTGTHALWVGHLGGLTFRVTQTAVLYGLTMALSLGGMILAFVLFNGVITTPKLSYLLFPVVPRLAMLLTISLRMVNLFTQKFRRLVMLQKTRGVVVGEGSWRLRLQKTGQLLRVLLIDSVSSAMETAVLMEARGFGNKKRSHYQTYRWQAMDGAFGLVTLVMFVLVIGLRTLGWGWTGDITQFTTLNGGDWWLAGSVLIFASLPLMGEVGYRVCEN
ncbi:energy-coupling factor transporter transmembrane component T [Levilactobacillus yiduensis]|uniref:energy-coupling factor transporter transmembrane component T n=1 Tax=Levilactobacillus yiduensis TaxID=2953880 RepID=UPI000EF30E6B|nr:energy-coupling factor transporter transmembrane component T [Levilactobacillus yiduensis]AYM02389.1 energy-coupling factor transporter transmembrane protein EcfT [Levilactobacillus brevis]